MRCDFFYDFSSPFAYLAATQIERVCAGHELVWRPFLLGALFKELGTANVPLLSFSPAKQALLAQDQYRWAEHWGVEFRFPRHFPQRSVLALRVALQAPSDKIGALSQDLFRVAWVEDGNVEDPAQLAPVIARHGLDPAALLAGAERPEIKMALKANTDEALRLGLCGAPSCVVDGRVFWGQDRLEFVQKALEGWVPVHERRGDVAVSGGLAAEVAGAPHPAPPAAGPEDRESAPRAGEGDAR